MERAIVKCVCVCMYVCVCVCMYVCVCVESHNYSPYMCIYIYIFFIHIYTWASDCKMCENSFWKVTFWKVITAVLTCAYIYSYMIHIYTCVKYVFTCAHISLYDIHISKCVNMYLHVHIYTDIFTHIYIYIYIHTYVYIHVYVYVCSCSARLYLARKIQVSFTKEP